MVGAHRYHDGLPRANKKENQKHNKVHKVMSEFKSGSLHIGKSNKIVKSRKQAVAIALSYTKRKKK